MSNIADRINFLIQDLALSKNAFAEKIGISSSLISQITTKKNNFRADILQKITSMYPDLNTAWLLNGVGSPWLSGKKDNIITKANQEELVTKSYVDNDAPLYLERHAQKKINSELMKGNDGKSKIFQNINTLLCFQYIIANLDHHYFENIEKKQYDVSKYYDGKSFNYEKYREDVMLEIDSVIDFAEPLEKIGKAIEEFYKNVKPADRKNVVDGFFSGV